MNLKGVTLALLSTQACAYVQHTNHRKPTALYGKETNKPSSPRGFGNSSMAKTYDFVPVAPVDQQKAMDDFFKTHAEWHPLFASIAPRSEVPAAASTQIDLTVEKGIVYDDEAPWVKLPNIPSGPEKESQMGTIALVLDSFQTALTAIPVSEEEFNTKDEEDNNDLQFLEEGRRLLVLQRFQVIDGVGSGNHDLFRTCWSEIHCLVSEGGEDTGSLIILDEFDHLDMDLACFVDANIRMPLQWLGMGDLVEVASFERGKNCVRLIHQLGAIPSLEDRDDELAATFE